MKLLLIAESEHYRDWVGKTYCDLLIYFKDNSKFNINLIYTDDEIEINNVKNKYNAIIFFDTDTLRFANRFSHLFNIGIPIFASSLDLFYFNQCINCPYIQKCNGILHFGYCTKLLTSYKNNFPNKIIKCFRGRFINSNRFKNYNLDKTIDILIYGTRYYDNDIENHLSDIDYKKKWELHHNKQLPNTYNFYPLRHKLEKLLQKNKNKYKLHIIHQSSIFNSPIANEQLSKLINKSWLTLSTCTRADIPMAKYFEIAASYSGILGNIPSDYTKLFKNNIIEVTEWMDDNQILNIIDNALEDKKKLSKMITTLGNIIHKEYNLEAGVKDMDNVFEEILKKQDSYINLNK